MTYGSMVADARGHVPSKINVLPNKTSTTGYL